MSWIRKFRDRLVVIKLGGSALEDEQTVQNLLADVIFLETVGMHPVLIHGGGKAINQAMKEAGIEPRWVHGRRYTDDATLEIVAKVLAGEISQDLIRKIQVLGGVARGVNFLNRNNALFGEKLLLPDEDGTPIDLGRVGHVTDVKRSLIEEYCREGVIPVIPSIALDADGGKLNVNADTAAAAVARILHAEKLVFLSDVPGICRDRKDPSTLISHLNGEDCRKLIQEGIIDSGMVPKVEAAVEALHSGVKKVHLLDGRMPHSILLEFYSNTGIGTEIVL
ncbi:MAG: acetylglutamate kinase [Planctomycetaceae bacterium]|nr:acetylglutamate kinase [Planctomycetaceae bacterium]